MNKVYIVTLDIMQAGEDDDRSILGVFSTKKKAEKRLAAEAATAGNILGDDYEVVKDYPDYFYAEGEDCTFALNIVKHDVR